MTCRELDRSRRESVKRKKQKRKKKERGDKKKRKDDRRRRTCELTVLARRSNPEVPRDLPVFATSRYSFSKYSPNFLFTGMCLLYPNPPLTTPRIRVRGKKPSPKMFFLHFLHRGKKIIFLTTIESNSSINNLGENRLRVIRFFS